MSAFPESALYSGHVWHKRLGTVSHAFRYRIFYLLLDLDHFETRTPKPWCLSLGGFNVFSVRQRDYGARMDTGLKQHIKQELIRAGIRRTPEKIYLLTLPRILGFSFNPISVFYCYDVQGDVMAIIYDVHNTFGDRHNYVFEITPDGTTIPDHGIDKSLYVSPFYEVTGKYKFRISEPRDTLSLLIHYLSDDDTPRMTANLSAEKKRLSAGRLMVLFFMMPLVTVKVVAAIHFEALRLWLKKATYVPRPKPPAQSFSVSPSKNH